jgi:methyl-accepting chemotaxis protein
VLGIISEEFKFSKRSGKRRTVRSVSEWADGYTGITQNKSGTLLFNYQGQLAVLVLVLFLSDTFISMSVRDVSFFNMVKNSIIRILTIDVPSLRDNSSLVMEDFYRYAIEQGRRNYGDLRFRHGKLDLVQLVNAVKDRIEQELARDRAVAVRDLRAGFAEIRAGVQRQDDQIAEIREGFAEIRAEMQRDRERIERAVGRDAHVLCPGHELLSRDLFDPDFEAGPEFWAQF